MTQAGEPGGTWLLQNRAHAHFNNVYVVSPNVGPVYVHPQMEHPYDIAGGNSHIVDYQGNVIGHTVSGANTFVAGIVDIEALRQFRVMNLNSNWMKDLRTELFRRMYEQPIHPANLWLEQEPLQHEAVDEVYQLHVRTVMIGLSESYEDYVARGYSAEGSSLSRRRFRRRGMPMATGPGPRPFGTGPACRLVKAAELQGVPQAEAVLRALRFGWFTTDLVMDDPATLRTVAESVDGLDAERALADCAHAGGRAGLPARPRRGALAHALRRQARPHRRQRRARPLHRAEPRPARRGARARRPGLPALRGGRRARHEPRAAGRAAAGALARLPCCGAYPGGLTTAEVARVLADTTDEPDLAEAEDALIRLCRRRRCEAPGTRSRRALDGRLAFSRPLRACLARRLRI